MADTADLRSEGERSQSSNAIFLRKRKKELTTKGLCNMCGVTEVQNRIVCYACSSKQRDKTYLSGLRYHCQVSDIEPDSMLIFLDTLRLDTVTQYEEVKKLKKLMTAAQYARKKNSFSTLLDKILW